MSEPRLLGVNLPTMTFGLIFEDGVCTDAPPIARWCIGHRLVYLFGYWEGRGARLRWINRSPRADLVQEQDDGDEHGAHRR